MTSTITDNTAELVERLLEGTTQGPWRWDRTEKGAYVIDTAFGVESANGYVIADYVAGKQSAANASLIAEAPNLARTVLAQASTIAALRLELERKDAALRKIEQRCHTETRQGLLAIVNEALGIVNEDAHCGVSAMQ